MFWKGNLLICKLSDDIEIKNHYITMSWSFVNQITQMASTDNTTVKWVCIESEWRWIQFEGAALKNIHSQRGI